MRRLQLNHKQTPRQILLEYISKNDCLKSSILHTKSMVYKPCSVKPAILPKSDLKLDLSKKALKTSK